MKAHREQLGETAGASSGGKYGRCCGCRRGKLLRHCDRYLSALFAMAAFTVASQVTGAGIQFQSPAIEKRAWRGTGCAVDAPRTSKPF